MAVYLYYCRLQEDIFRAISFVNDHSDIEFNPKIKEAANDLRHLLAVAFMQSTIPYIIDQDHYALLPLRDKNVQLFNSKCSKLYDQVNATPGTPHKLNRNGFDWCMR